MTVKPDSPVTAAGLTDRRVAFFAFAAGTAGLVCVIALGLVYARESDTAGPRVFRQISELTAAEFNLYPRGLGTFAIAAGAALLGGLTTIAIGLFLQPGTESPFWTLGVALGVLGWVSLPIWFLLAGVSLRTGLVPEA